MMYLSFTTRGAEERLMRFHTGGLGGLQLRDFGIEHEERASV